MNIHDQMQRQPASALAESRRLATDLRDLRSVETPASLLPAVLVGVGLGDGYWLIETPIGPVFVAHNREGISAVMPADNDAAFEEWFAARFGRSAHPMKEPPLAVNRAIRRWLDEGARTGLRFDLRGLSEFERAVLNKSLQIPRGEVRPYGWIAREIGRPRAVRAVGSALGRNPAPLLIPCHRAVRSDGRIGDYAFGSDAKRTMLAAEGTRPDEIEGLARRGVRYTGSDTTRIFCFPTCHNARRTTDRHLVTFTSEAAAIEAGYRPCKVCRPAIAS